MSSRRTRVHARTPCHSNPFRDTVRPHHRKDRDHQSRRHVCGDTDLDHTYTPGVMEKEGQIGVREMSEWAVDRAAKDQDLDW